MFDGLTFGTMKQINKGNKTAIELAEEFARKSGRVFVKLMKKNLKDKMVS